ncbi:MAG: hypothetical protein HY738_12740 [Bacteroidia bacterium]|nr:hypothetical protein [Bacteroidia bacterium]
MQIIYNFSENTEPTDEQLHLLMLDVASDVKERARKAEEKFFKQLEETVQRALIQYKIYDKGK